MAKHKMNKRQIDAMKLRRSKYFVTLESASGNVPKHHLFPEKNTFPFVLDAERRSDVLLAYYGAKDGFSYTDLQVVQHGKLPYGRAFSERCRLNLVAGNTLASDAGMVLAALLPGIALFMLLLFTLFNIQASPALGQFALGSFILGSILILVSVPGRALVQAKKMQNKASLKTT
jgi:hypothetical protein